MQIQQVAAVAGIQHIAGVGQRSAGFGEFGKLLLADAPLLAKAYVQAQLHIHNGFQALVGLAQIRQGGAFVGGQRVGAGKVNQEQIILLQVVAKRRLRQRGVAQLVHEIVLDIRAPIVLASGGEIGKAVAHCVPPVVMIRRAGEKDRGNGTEGWRKGAPRPSLDPYAGTRVAIHSNALAGSGSAGPVLGSQKPTLRHLSRISPAPRQAVRWWSVGGGWGRCKGLF